MGGKRPKKGLNNATDAFTIVQFFFPRHFPSVFHAVWEAASNFSAVFWGGCSFQVEALLPKDLTQLAVHVPPELAALLAQPERLDPVKIPAGHWGGWGCWGLPERACEWLGHGDIHGIYMEILGLDDIHGDTDVPAKMGCWFGGMAGGRCSVGKNLKVKR